jgi:parallel beta-helix repeat protein
VLDGAGYTVTGSGKDRGVDLSNWTGQNPTNVFNVTVKNMQIFSFSHGIDSMNSWGNSFIGNYVANCSTGIWLFCSGGDYIALNTFQNNVEGVHLDYSGKGIIINENNFVDNSEVNVYMFLSQKPIVDRNYWSDYLTKYPNATKACNTGFWDTPYRYSDANLEDNTDNNPQISLVTGAPLPLSSPSIPPETSAPPTPTIDESTSVLAAVGIIVAFFAVISLIAKKKR